MSSTPVPEDVLRDKLIPFLGPVDVERLRCTSTNLRRKLNDPAVAKAILVERPDLLQADLPALVITQGGAGTVAAVLTAWYLFSLRISEKLGKPAT